MRINKKILPILVLVLIAVIFSLTKNIFPHNKNDDNVAEDEKAAKEAVPAQIEPTLDVSQEYFAKDSMIIDRTTEIEVGLPPSTEIKKTNYYNEVRPLPPIKKLSDALPEEKGGVVVFQRQDKLESYKKFGQIALRFLPDEYIYDLKNADLDRDGINEQIITLVFPGASSPAITSIVVKGNNIVFETSGYQPEIIPAPSGDGFYVDDRNAYKWQTGHIRTRFIWKDDKFVPLFEQEILYVKVGK